MANIMVAGDLYESITGQLFEIGRQLRQPNGYPFDPLQLKVHLQAGIEGRFGVITDFFKRDMRKEGWILLDNAPRRLSSAVSGVSFLKEDESSIDGEEMVHRARVELDANYGQEDAEWLLDNQDKIPAELRNFYPVFPATIWRDSGGRRSVPSLHWRGDGWVLYFFWLDSDWSSSDRLVVPRK